MLQACLPRVDTRVVENKQLALISKFGAKLDQEQTWRFHY